MGLLFDEGGARYGLMTTNLAEVYNWVLRGVRSLPLVGIVEFFLYRTCEYFRYRYAVAQKDMVDNRKVYGYKVMEHMEEAFKKPRLHRVTPVGSMEHRYEVMCRDKGRMGAGVRSMCRSVFSVLMLVFAHVISQSCCTCRAHMSLLPILKLVDYRLVCMSHITS